MKKLWLLLAPPIVILDQLVKRWAAETLQYSPSRPFIPGVDLTYAENTGAAFSILSGPGARWFLVSVSTLAVIAIIAAVFKRWIDGLFGVVAISCVLGGAAGNLADRIFNGYVVDMFEFTFMRFAIFNVADIFITAGGIGFCIAVLLEARKTPPLSRKGDACACLDDDGR
jgi:signal peptidase II